MRSKTFTLFECSIMIDTEKNVPKYDPSMIQKKCFLDKRNCSNCLSGLSLFRIFQQAKYAALCRIMWDNEVYTPPPRQLDGVICRASVGGAWERGPRRSNTQMRLMAVSVFPRPISSADSGNGLCHLVSFMCVSRLTIPGAIQKQRTQATSIMHGAKTN